MVVKAMAVECCMATAVEIKGGGGGGGWNHGGRVDSGGAGDSGRPTITVVERYKATAVKKTAVQRSISTWSRS